MLTGLLYGLCGSVLAEGTYVDPERGFRLRLPVGWSRSSSEQGQLCLSNGRHQILISLFERSLAEKWVREYRAFEDLGQQLELEADHVANVIAVDQGDNYNLGVLFKDVERGALLLIELDPNTDEDELRALLALCLSFRFQ